MNFPYTRYEFLANGKIKETFADASAEKSGFEISAPPASPMYFKISDADETPTLLISTEPFDLIGSFAYKTLSTFDSKVGGLLVTPPFGPAYEVLFRGDHLTISKPVHYETNGVYRFNTSVPFVIRGIPSSIITGPSGKSQSFWRIGDMLLGIQWVGCIDRISCQTFPLVEGQEYFNYRTVDGGWTLVTDDHSWKAPPTGIPGLPSFIGTKSIQVRSGLSQFETSIQGFGEYYIDIDCPELAGMVLAATRTGSAVERVRLISIAQRDEEIAEARRIGYQVAEQEYVS
jgi:hypothetical protein